MGPEPEITSGLTDDELADLARLADGTLPAGRRAEVEARVAASPQLARIVARQAAAVESVRATADTGAPARLRAKIERRQRSGQPTTGSFGSSPMRAAIAAATAMVLVLALALPGALHSGPSVAGAAALAQKPPTRAGPPRVPGTPELLSAAVDDVRFPNYAAKFGWQPAGAREDDLSGRHATTVYYRQADRTIAYTIVSGNP